MYETIQNTKASVRTSGVAGKETGNGEGSAKKLLKTVSEMSIRGRRDTCHL